MTTCLGKSCSFGLPRAPFVNCCQFMYLVISLLVLRAGCGIWLFRFLIIAYLFTLYQLFSCAILKFLWCFYLDWFCLFRVQLDEIKCALLHKISYLIFALFVKQAQNWLIFSAVCVIYFSVSNKYFAFRIMFRKFRHFSLTVCIKHGFTGTCQIFADIYKNIPQTVKVILFRFVSVSFSLTKKRRYHCISSPCVPSAQMS